MIIVNNVVGTINMDLTGYSYTAPAVSILKSEGETLKTNSTFESIQGLNVYTGKVLVTAEKTVAERTAREDAEMSVFSSWGIPGSLTLKPEITAPGGSIYSVWGANTGEDSPTDRHDQYESMGGTSMAAPHIAGLAALLGQYIRENDLAEKTGLSQRALINSLLMSTATPMKNDGEYIPVLQQGAGLAEVSRAMSASAYILMDENATMLADSAKDGKVKVELGQDAARKGEYSYSFNIVNFGEETLVYDLKTDLFTQLIYEDDYGDTLMSTDTTALDAEVTYAVDSNGYDVNLDGLTNGDDVQAILDKITGELAENAKFDAEVADMDGDGSITSYDAYLLAVYVDFLRNTKKAKA